MAVAVYLFVETAKPSGSRDFHQFWYAGHFVRQGQDPYEAFFAREQPQLPVRYLDGVIVDHYPVAQSNLAMAPTNTPIMVLLLTPFSFFSWSVAKWMFLAVNLILMAVTGWLVLRRVPFAGVQLAKIDELLLFLIYFDLSATRIAIENGQTTLIVFLCMLLAILYAKRSRLVAGLALGLALAKYSLSLPVFLFFIYKRNVRLLLLAVILQGLGVLALAALTQSSPVTIAMENVRLFVEIFNQPGVYINLASQFDLLTQNQLVRHIPVLFMTLLVFLLAFLWLRRRKATVSSGDEVMDFHILTILFIWTMLVGYHRLYDTLILFFFLVLVFKGLAYPNVWKLGSRERTLLLFLLAAIPPILILPERIVDQVFPWYYGPVSNGVTAALFVVMLICSMYLLRRYVQARRIARVSEAADSTLRHIQPGSVEP
ncbi:MAG TPA: glycosyltransferase family 87 protein [Anaerolineales bacterium]|nr:glycosyltransferase family 87 protein [Anaerolineales bacterium]